MTGTANRRHFITPRHRRRLAKLQHKIWVDAQRYGIPNPLPMQLYKHLKRIKLPRRPGMVFGT